MSPKIDAPYLDTTVRLGRLKFSLRATVDHQGPSIHSGHYTTLSIVAKNLLQRSHSYGVWNYWQQYIMYCICYIIWIDCHMFFWTRTGGWKFDRSYGAGTSSPSHWQQVEEQAPKPMGWMMCFLLMTFVPVQKLCFNKYIYVYIYICSSIWALFSLVYKLCLADLLEIEF